MIENKLQKEFRLAMNELLATEPHKKHVFEAKNFYTDNSEGPTCLRYKIAYIKDKFYPLINQSSPKE